jgi:hypothetical protein
LRVCTALRYASGDTEIRRLKLLDISELHSVPRDKKK